MPELYFFKYHNNYPFVFGEQEPQLINSVKEAVGIKLEQKPHYHHKVTRYPESSFCMLSLMANIFSSVLLFNKTISFRLFIAEYKTLMRKVSSMGFDPCRFDARADLAKFKLIT